MPDSSLRVRLCFFFHNHSDSARRSRMTAELFLICHDVLTCVRKHAPFASRSSTLSPKSGKADTKEERIYSFLYKLNPKNNEMTHTKKPSPDTGKVAALAVGRGKCEQKQKVRKWFP